MTRAVTVFMALYLPLAGIVLLYSLLGYARFIKKLRRSSSAPHPSRYDMLAMLTNGKRTPRLIVSGYAVTPMLVGLFRPTIVLPKKVYRNEQLQNILLHELVHMRRLDVLVKWLTLLACGVHWFNPFVWLLRREIGRACELSCDEAVIGSLDTQGKQHYGDTLICVASNKKIPMPVLSTMMCAEKRALKERLSAIMKNKKHTKLTLLVSAILFLAVTLTACAIAAGSNPEYTPPPNPAPYAANGQDADEVSPYETSPYEGDLTGAAEPGQQEDTQQTAPPRGAINIRSLVGANFDEAQHLFGTLVRVEERGLFKPHYFDTGLVVGTDDWGGDEIIIFIRVDFGYGGSAGFHYDTIDATFTREAVRALLGTPDNSIAGAYIFYTIVNEIGWPEQAVSISFDGSDHVTAITFG